MLIRCLPYFLASFTVSALTGPAFGRIALRADALDRGIRGMVPRLGGGGIFLAFLLPALYLLTYTAAAGRLPVILLASFAVFAAGVYDDVKGAAIWIKLLVETLAALLVYSGGVRMAMPGGLNGFGFFHSGWLSFPVTILWILIVTNSVNLIDGLDGLAAGTGITASMVLLVFGGLPTYGLLACALLAGGLAGFLIYNLPPASVHMGDSGSLFTGFMLACLSVSSLDGAATPAAGIVSVVVFSIPLMDMLYAVLRRYYRGLPLGRRDREHIHHKLLEQGFSGNKALFVLYSVNFAIVSVCLFLSRISGPVSVLALLLAAAILGLRGFGYIKFLPFAKEMFENAVQGRRRRYCNFAIRRFAGNASMALSLDSFGAEIEKLAVSVRLRKVEIVLDVFNDKIPFFLYAGGQDAEKQFTLCLPIIWGQGKNLYSGQIRISVCAGSGFMPYSACIVHALSEEVVRFLARKSFSPAFSLEAVESLKTLGA